METHFFVCAEAEIVSEWIEFAEEFMSRFELQDPSAEDVAFDLGFQRIFLDFM